MVKASVIQLTAPFEIKRKDLIVTDPCYRAQSDYNTVIENVLPGLWRVHLTCIDRERYDVITVRIQNVAEGAHWTDNSTAFKVVADSGSLGLYDLGCYRKDKAVNAAVRSFKKAQQPADHHIFDLFEADGTRDRWFALNKACCLSDYHYAVLPFGFVIQTPDGDGGYNGRYYKKNGKVVAVEILL